MPDSVFSGDPFKQNPEEYLAPTVSLVSSSDSETQERERLTPSAVQRLISVTLYLVGLICLSTAISYDEGWTQGLKVFGLVVLLTSVARFFIDRFKE